MADFLSQATPFTIEVLESSLAGRVLARQRNELTGQFSNLPPGTLSLVGRMLPYRSISFEVEQRMKTTRYTGNPVATQQVLGPVDNNTVISGTWKDIFLGNGEAQNLVDVFDSICRAGVTVRVTWGGGILPSGETVGHPTIRIGKIKRFKPTPERPQDQAWECEFEWQGRDEPTAPPVTSIGVLNPREGFDELSQDLQATQDAIDAFEEDPFALLAQRSSEFQDALDDAQNVVARTIGYIDETTGAITSLTDLPANIIDRVRGLSLQAAGSLANLAEAFVGLDMLKQEVKDDALDLLDALQRRAELLSVILRNQETAVNTESELAALAFPEVVAEVRASVNTDLRDLARQFYGDPELWWLIANFNNLSSSRVPEPPTGPSDNPATPIRIPRRAEGGTSAGPGC